LSQYDLEFPAATRVALVGAGFIADFHLEILHQTPDVQVVALCDSDLERARSLAAKWGVPTVVGSVAELGGVGVQLAHVLTPPATHAAVARECLEAGFGALVEKPFTLDAAEARALGELARELRLPLGVNHNALFNPTFTQGLERARSGALGRIEHVQLSLSVPLRQLDAGQFGHWMFAEPWNIILEQGPHPLAQIESLLGPVRRATTTLVRSRELNPGQVFHDTWVVAAEAERGSAELFLSFGRPFPHSRIQVLCSDGGVELDLQHGLVAQESKTLWLDFWNSFLAGHGRARSLGRGARRGLRDYLGATLGLHERRDSFFAGMRSSLQAFHRNVRAGAPLPSDAEDAARVLDWCAAVYKPALTRARRAGVEPEAPPPVGGEARAGEICVLGASGFIGRRAVERLLARGLPVTAVVRRTQGLPPALLDNARAGRLRLVLASLSDPAALARAVEGARVVLHLATGNGTSWEDIERDMLGGSCALFEAARAAGVERFVFVSTIAALYLGADAPGWKPGAESLEDDVELDPKAAQRALYARGKAATEQALGALAESGGPALVTVRPGVVLGPGTPLQHSGLGLWVRDNHCVGWGMGEHPLPLVGVDDVAEALAALAELETDELDGQALNLCARVELSAKEVVEELARTSGRELSFHPRPLFFSQLLELGKWLVKRAGGRVTPLPSYRDLKSRSLRPPFSARNARRYLGWRPVEERERFLAEVVRPMADPGSSQVPT